MAEAGCEGVFLGAESGSDTMLKAMNKTSRRHHYMDAIASFRQAGISTYASLIVGFPGETEETVEETISFVEEARPEYFRAQLWYADPVTPIWQRREEWGGKGQGFAWQHNTMDAERACDWIEEMFLRVRNSTWLPQFGFEQWALFYLQRKGMSRDGVRHFVQGFNSAIRHRLLSFGGPLPQEILGALQRSADFPGSEQPFAALDPWSAARYSAASAALTAELAGAPAAVREHAPRGRRLRLQERRAVQLPTMANLLKDGDEEAKIALLAAYAAAIRRTAGPGVIHVAPGDAADSPPVPMNFTTPPDAPVEAWEAEAREKWRRLVPHAPFLARIFHSSPLIVPSSAQRRPMRLLRLSPNGPGRKPAWMAEAMTLGIAEACFVTLSGAVLTIEGHVASAKAAATLPAQLAVFAERLIAAQSPQPSGQI